ncbi:cell division protein ZapE [Williamsia sp. 1135]|uniref:cell division protein ZapE n=1 Tax=Williamsia sp. 1135 TaxID=1889262 RepID=UPI000A104243|nr:cell division protein ZapE [Williamsia sp. 1135]ORM36470.1 cell division protein ZapE [Williamsia sp. 1135]
MHTKQQLVAAVDAAATQAGFSLDVGQRRLLDRLADFAANLDEKPKRRSTSRGLYIYGEAGRGKSWLTDAFYSALPTNRKTRVHFHGFFDELHRSIHDHRTEREAVDRAIEAVTGTGRLLFFDELHVHDSGDARLLTRLLDHAFRQGVLVLATSNYAPDDLLPNPIWHHTFEPGIDLNKTNMGIFHLEGPDDYRSLRIDHSFGFASGTWTTKTSAVLPDCVQETTVTVRGRRFPILAARSGHLWATFDQICNAPTSTIEYLEWARTFSTWTVTGVPLLRDTNPEAQQRFINLIDVLVDADVRLHFISPHELTTFLESAVHRPDAFRMASRMQLLRSKTGLDSPNHG